MNESLALTRLSEGQSAYVTDLNTDEAMLRRLNDLGLIRGTRVTCLYLSPAGDPVAYRIRGAVIALRCRDAGRIQVNPIPAPVSTGAAEVPLPWV